MGLRKSTFDASEKPELDFDPSYHGHYGDASAPLERRMPGTQPNSRAKSAVERAEERARAATPAAKRRQKTPQMPGMDIGYHADRDLDHFRSGDLGGDVLDENEEVILTKAQQRQRPRMAQVDARMAPVGRTDVSGRQTPRVPHRDRYGRVMALNRAGKLISRTSYATTDKFEVPLSFIPDGWTYQWLSQSTVGKANNNAHFYANGWEPVPTRRHDGVFMAKGTDGPIIVDDMILVERPVELTLEARAEEVKAAKSLIRTQNEQFQPKLPGARSRRYRGTELSIKRELEEMPDDLRPQHVIDDGSYEDYA
jgi:hypothetical protein